MLNALVLAQEDSGGDLISVVPGLMIWTIVTFAIVLFVLRKFAFGRIQGLIDERRDRIRQALDAADKAREEARELRELTRKERDEARAERERLLDDSRRQGQQQIAQGREQAAQDLERRHEENRKLREAIRRDVVELTVLASERVTGKVLDAEDQRRLIDETVQEIDVNRIASDN